MGATGHELTPEERLAEQGFELPPLMTTTGHFDLTARHGSLVFVAGHVPVQQGRWAYVGKVGREFDVGQAQEAARLVALSCLSSLRTEVGELSKVVRVLKVVGLVNSTPEFDQQSKVMDAASEVFNVAFGERGPHARSAIGVAALPHGVVIEIEMVVAVERPSP